MPASLATGAAPDRVLFDYAMTLAGLAALARGDARAAADAFTLAGITEPGARFNALWPRDPAQLRDLLRLPELAPEY